MNRSIKGFEVDWSDARRRQSVRAERETAPRHRYLFEVDGRRIVWCIDTSDPDKDADLEEEAAQAVEEFLRLEYRR